MRFVLKFQLLVFDGDLSRGMLEPFSLPAVNCYSKDLPDKFVYLKRNKFSSKSREYIDTKARKNSGGCSCEGRCSIGCECRTSDESSHDYGFYFGRLFGRHSWFVLIKALVKVVFRLKFSSPPRF